ncbi:MAG: cation transporter [Ruminococcaceae bacterium]|nr:cation transporter [Oscillospiraceae bacterium]
MGSNTVLTSDKRLKIGRMAGIIGIAVNFLLFVLKICVGIITGSVSVSADAINNLSDAMSSVFVLVGYVLAAKPADKEHPFGHARMEYLCGLFISVIITVLGIEMLRSAGGSLVDGGNYRGYSTVTIIVMVSTAGVKIALAIFYRILGKKIDSQSLRASAVDSFGDVAATAAVVLGMILTPHLGNCTDGVLGIIIGVYIVILGLKLVKESAGTLLGLAPDSELVNDVTAKIRQYDGILGIHDLVIHSYGEGRIFATVHVEVDCDTDPLVSHDLIDNIEADFLKNTGITLVIHMDPVCLSDPKTNSLRETVAQIVLDLSEEIGSNVSMHDFRVVWGVTHTNLIFDVAVSDEMPLTDDQLSTRIAEKIEAIDSSYNTVICVDRDYHSTRFGTER